MNISEIISNSFKYPLGDKDNFKYVALLFLLVGLPLAGLFTTIDLAFLGIDSDAISGLVGIMSIILGFLGFILALIAPGYSVSVIKEGIEQSGIVPSLDIGRNIVDTHKLWVISFIYMIIPSIIIFVLFFIFTVLAAGGSSDSSALILILGLFIGLIVFIVMIAFELLYYVGMMRFAKYGSISEAINISEVIADLKEIGIIKLILVIIVLNIIVSIILFIGYLIGLIPIIGGLVFGCLVLPFILLAYHYALGLLYSEIA